MATDTTTPETTTDETEAKPGLVGRIKGGLGSLLKQPVRLALIGGGLVGAIGAVILAVWLLLPADEIAPEDLTLERALELFDAGEFETAEKIAKRLNDERSIAYSDLGGPLYLLGALAMRDSRLQLNEDREAQFIRLAARYLEEARDFGFPPGRSADGLYLLGKSLHDSEQFATSIPILRDALKQNPQRATELHGLLTSSYLNDSPPQYDRALEHLQEHLSDRTLSPRARHSAVLQEFAVLFGQDRLAEGRNVLEQVPDDSTLRSEKAFSIGRLLMREGDVLLADAKLAPDVAMQQANKKYAAAVKAFQLAQGSDTSQNGTTPKARYQLGICYRKLKEYRAAQKQFDRILRLTGEAPEGLAAGLELAEVLQLEGDDKRAVATFATVLEAAGDPEEYYNRWLPLGQLQDRVYQAFVRYREEGDFESAVAMSELIFPLFPRDRQVEIQAKTHQSWGRSLITKSQSLSTDAADRLASEGRAKLRLAGRDFALLARLRRTSRNYGDYLWSSAESYLQGHAFRRSVEVHNKYLENVAKRRRPPALVALGEAELAIGNVDKALKALLECIAGFPTHPDSYRARLLAGQAYLELNDEPDAAEENILKAKQLLEDNLHNEALTPRSSEWRQSLFLLGEVHYRQGLLQESESTKLARAATAEAPDKKLVELMDKTNESFQQAAERLGEAVKRYPDDKQARRARFLLAEAHRHSASYAQRRLSRTAIESTRLALREQIKIELTSAMGIYDQLIESLNDRSDRFDLSDIELGFLRNSYFGKADSLFEQRDYETAASAYGSAANRFHNRPESLEALVQIARCQRELGRDDLALGALERALATLEQIPTEVDLTKTTRYDRTTWLDLLKWMISLFADADENKA